MRQHDLSLWTIPTQEKKPTSSQIEEFMIALIKSGAVKPLECIPSHRVLAKLNHVNRNTALRVYTKLIATGWLSHSKGSKATVSAQLPMGNGSARGLMMPETLPRPIQTNDSRQKSPSPKNVSFIELGTGQIKMTMRVGRTVNPRQNHDLNGKKSANIEHLVLQHLQTRGFMVKVQHMLIVRDRSACLRCIFKTLGNEKGIIINSAPDDLVVPEIIREYNDQVIDIDMGSDHFLDTLERMVSSRNIKAIYLRPNGCYPTCKSLDDATRCRLIELSNKNEFYIIEEDDDHEFWWGKSPMKPLAQLDHSGYVIHCAALSRASTYLQHMRTIIAPSQFIMMLREMPSLDFGYQNSTEEKMICDILSNHQLVILARQMRLSKQKDLLVLKAILNLQLGQHISFEIPESGTAIWITFPHRFDLTTALNILKSEGLKLKFKNCSRKSIQSVHHMRLDFSEFDESECRKAAIKLRGLCSEKKR